MTNAFKSLYGTYKPQPGQSFVGVKKVTVPGQSLSLREILRRYVRRENLPVGVSEGVYESRFGDLEKISKMDLVDQAAHIQDLKDAIAAFNARQKKEAEEAAVKKEQELKEAIKAEALKELEKTSQGVGSPPTVK